MLDSSMFLSWFDHGRHQISSSSEGRAALLPYLGAPATAHFSPLLCNVSESYDLSFPYPKF